MKLKYYKNWSRIKLKNQSESHEISLVDWTCCHWWEEFVEEVRFKPQMEEKRSD